MNLGRIARRARHFPDRVMHPIRRRRTQQRVADTPRLQHVTFICHGNICRSPYAAAAFASSLPNPMREQVRTTSSGFISPGRPAPAEALAAAAKRRVDLSSHISCLIDGEALRSADLIVVMEAGQRREIVRRFGTSENVVVLGDLDPLPIEKRTIRDPFGQSEQVFNESYARIDRCLRELLRALQIPAAQPNARAYPAKNGEELRQR